MRPDPLDYGWWLASRSAGIVALLAITASVAIGLAMAGRVSQRPALARTLLAAHQQTALVGLVAVAVHGITLLGDHYLDPGLLGIAVPFVIDHAPLWTGLGVSAGWLAAVLGLSYWLRHRIGPRRWRSLHRATLLVYVLAVAHTLGSGTDASEPWLRALLLATGAPVLFLLVMRVLPAARPADPFRRLRVAEVLPESRDVLSFALEPADGGPLPDYVPGQFVTLRIDVPGAGTQLRSYSLSSAPDPARWRISVKREEAGLVSRHLHGALAPGDEIDASGPAGRFALGDGDRPAVLLSAGIGATPLLAMLDALARTGSGREVWWVHGSRCGAEHAFREEARALVARLARGRIHVRYSRPEPRDAATGHHHAEGRLDAAAVLALGVPPDADFRLCGAPGFVRDLTDGLVAAGVAPEGIRSESFGAAPAPRRAEAGPPVAAGGGPAVAFARAGLTAAWDGRFSSLLELAEAHRVPAASGCRVGACHGCASAVLAGAVRHDPEPLAPPPAGSALLCCARPLGDVVLDI